MSRVRGLYRSPVQLAFGRLDTGEHRIERENLAEYHARLGVYSKWICQICVARF